MPPHTNEMPNWYWLAEAGAGEIGMLVVALLLLAGAAMGELAGRLRLPAIVGYALAGIGAGYVDRVTPWADLAGPARLLGELGLGVLLFDLGRRVDLSWWRRDASLAATALLEMGATFAACFVLLTAFDVPAPWAAVAAAVAMSSSPAVAVAVVRDLRAQGQVTERLLWLSGVNTVAAALATTMLLAWLHAEYAASPWMALLHPLYLVAGSLTLAAAVAWGLSAGGGFMGPGGRLLGGLAAVLLTLALARGGGLSVPLALIALGLLTHIFDRRRQRRSQEFGDTARPLVVLFFVFAGTGLALTDFGRYAVPALALVAVRWLAKWLAVGVTARFSGLDFRRSFRLGLALMPMSGISLMLATDAGRLYPELGADLTGILVTAIAILEVAGPLATHFALVRAGEAASEERHG